MKKFLSLLLILSTLFCGFGCEKAEVTEEPVTFSLNGDYYVVRAEKMAEDENIVSAMNYLSEAIEFSCGTAPYFSDDWHKKNSPIVPNEYEILIGETNRPESIELKSKLKYEDYGYSVISENVIAICGGSPAATELAVKKFCADMLGYDGGDAKENAVLTVGDSFIYRAKYDYSAVTLNGVPIEEYTVAVAGEKERKSAIRLIEKLAGYNGHLVPIKKYSELDGSEAAVICLGASDTSGRADVSLGEHLFKISTRNENNKTVISIDNAYASTLDACVNAFSDKIGAKGSGDSIALSIAAESEILAYTFEGSIPKWELEKETVEEFHDGIKYVERLYYDEASRPYRVYALYVDPSKASLYMGSTNDGYDYSLDGINKMNVAEHMQAAIANGVNAIAGVNGDFFAISEDFRPRGLTIKEGKLVGENTSRSWVGFTYDGHMVIGTSGEYASYEGKLRTAVGGRQIVLRDGTISQLELGTDFSETPHPRTLAGYMEDGTMILVVVDGRQKSVSNGAPLARCALLMEELGAVTAINLDGGGSSCMVLRRGENDFETMNSPSYVRLRKVYNSLLLVPNK